MVLLTILSPPALVRLSHGVHIHQFWWLRIALALFIAAVGLLEAVVAPAVRHVRLAVHDGVAGAVVDFAADAAHLQRVTWIASGLVATVAALIVGRPF